MPLSLPADQPPAKPIDWPRWLARLLPPESTRVTDYRRLNRRYPERIGVIPGRSIRRAHRSVLAVIDTSGSMEKDELNAIGQEVERLARYLAVTVVECDDAIRRVYAIAETLDAVSGRGGTDLRPPFAGRLYRDRKADAVIYFTDGDGPFPEYPPSVPVLWVLTGERTFACPWGLKTRLPVVQPAESSFASRVFRLPIETDAGRVQGQLA